MAQATVKTYNGDRGVGLLIPNDGSASLFAYASGISGTITANDQVSYDTEVTVTGTIAVNVTKIS